MGHRIVSSSNKITKIGPLSFSNYGSHHEAYQHLPYITFASAVGTKIEELKQFFQRLDESIKELIKKTNKKHIKNSSKNTSEG